MVQDPALTRSRLAPQLLASHSDHVLTLMSAAKTISSQRRRMVPAQDHMNSQGPLTPANNLRILPLERLRETGPIYPRTPQHLTNTRISLNTLKRLMPIAFPKLLRVMRNSLLSKGKFSASVLVTTRSAENLREDQLSQFLVVPIIRERRRITMESQGQELTTARINHTFQGL